MSIKTGTCNICNTEGRTIKCNNSASSGFKCTRSFCYKCADQRGVSTNEFLLCNWTKTTYRCPDCVKQQLTTLETSTGSRFNLKNESDEIRSLLDPHPRSPNRAQPADQSQSEHVSSQAQPPPVNSQDETVINSANARNDQVDDLNGSTSSEDSFNSSHDVTLLPGNEDSELSRLTNEQAHLDNEESLPPATPQVEIEDNTPEIPDNPANGEARDFTPKVTCKYFKAGYCRLTKRLCRYEHPKLCKFYLRDPQHGCRKEACSYDHPRLCQNYEEYGVCTRICFNFHRHRASNRRINRPNNTNNSRHNFPRSNRNNYRNGRTERLARETRYFQNRITQPDGPQPHLTPLPLSHMVNGNSSQPPTAERNSLVTPHYPPIPQPSHPPQVFPHPAPSPPMQPSTTPSPNMAAHPISAAVVHDHTRPPLHPPPHPSLHNVPPQVQPNPPAYQPPPSGVPHPGPPPPNAAAHPLPSSPANQEQSGHLNDLHQEHNLPPHNHFLYEMIRRQVWSEAEPLFHHMTHRVMTQMQVLPTIPGQQA